MKRERHWLPLRAILALLFCLLLTSCGGGTVELLGSLPESEANEVMGVLLNAAIDVKKVPGKEGMVSLEVGRDSVARAIDVLQELGLPRHIRPKMGDVFKKENLISSPLEERARYLYALSQELEQTLSQIDGVIAARVHVVLPERLGPGDPNVPSSAAVFIKYQQGSGLENLVGQIRAMVANAVSGLNAEKVSVALFPSKNTSTATTVRWTDVFFFRVQESSALALRILLIVMTLVSLAGLAATGYLVHKMGWIKKMPGAFKAIENARAGTKVSE